MCHGLQDVIILPKINTKAHLYDLQRLKDHCTMKTRQIPVRSLPSFVVSSKSLNSSFTHLQNEIIPSSLWISSVYLRIKDKAHFMFLKI